MLRFDPIEHKYWWGIDGTEIQIPSVSRLLQPLREPFSAPDHVVEKARRRGERVHLMTHQYDTGQYVATLAIEPDIYDDCMRMFDAYVKWVKGREVTESELAVCYDGSTWHNYKEGGQPLYAGTLDKVINGRVVDIKCTSKIEDTHGLQAYMYHIAYTPTTERLIAPPLVLRLTKDSKAFIWEVTKAAKDVFIAIVDMLITKYWYWDTYKNRRGLIKRR